MNNDVIDTPATRSSQPAPDAPGAEDDAAQLLKTWGWVSYILHLIVAIAAVVPGVQSGIALLIVALILDLVKKSQAAGTWQASHFSWRLRTVLWVALLYLVTVPLWLLLIWPGWMAWLIISVWFLYRIVKGMERMNAGRPVGESQA